MSVYMIIQTKEITDSEKYASYTSKARPIVESYGGKYLVSTDNIMNINWSWSPVRMVIIEFPDDTSFDKCFASDEYKKIIHLRTESVKGEAILVESLL